jgi:hypothetical protein
MRSRIFINYDRSFRDDTKSADATIQLDPNSSEVCIPRRVCKELQCSWVIYVGTTANFKSLQNMMGYCRTIKYDEKTDDNDNKSVNYSCSSSDDDRGRQKSYSISVTRPALHMNDNSDSEDEDDADQACGVSIHIGVLQDH